jgi:hypothetical protein
VDGGAFHRPDFRVILRRPEFERPPRCAAPLGGWAVKHIPARTLMIAVGCLVIGLSLWQIARALKLV